MKQDVIAAGKSLAVTATAAGTAWIFDVAELAKAVTIIIAMLVVLVQLIYYSVKTYRYIRKK